LGERKLANLRKLIDQARSYQQGDFLRLSDFIRQLSEFVVNQPDEPLAATHSENTNVVRLMSVHQAKGLEFPIVVVPDIDRTGTPPGKSVRFDAELGPLVRVRETADGQPCMSGYDLWRIVERAEEAAEMNRLLYVATTRAADYLILSSSVERAGAATSPWTKLLARRFDLVSGQFIGTLPEGAAHPRVRVTTEEPEVASARGPAARRVAWDALFATARAALAAEPQVMPGIDPLAIDGTARRQYSFSRLAGTLHRPFDREDPAEDPRTRNIDARGLGTLVHAVLAAADHRGAPDYARLVALHAERHLPRDSAEVATAVEMLQRFAGSPRARQLARANELHVEVEFLLAWPPDAEAHKTVISGFLDLLYQDAGGDWHILDFKTNQIGKQGPAHTAAGYEMQMLLYGLAAERILGAAPRSLALHFLRTGDEHAFAWDERARGRVIALVDQGIRAAEQVS
jgi:ATP-dependent helicase/nuclease subunit A